VRNILNVKHPITKEPLSLFFTDLEPKENNKGIHDMEFLCNMKITVEAPRPKNTSSNAQDVNLMVIQEHTVQNHMPSLNVEKPQHNHMYENIKYISKMCAVRR
jgi:hypothetical protein